jgi:hypothetical protein
MRGAHAWGAMERKGFAAARTGGNETG